jgi:hypothetical protein
MHTPSITESIHRHPVLLLPPHEDATPVINKQGRTSNSPTNNKISTTSPTHAGSQFQKSNIGNGATVDAAIQTLIPAHLSQQEKL